MGTIAARDLLRIIELTEQVICAGLVASTQGIQIRLNRGELSEEMIGKNISNFMSFFRKTVRFVEEDRPLEGELRDLMALIKLRRKELVS